MEQYIKKSALVAEIERLYKKWEMGNYIYWKLISFIDTLEVKDVDLDYIKKELDELIRVNKPNGDFGWGTLYNVATHFFELGLQARIDKELVEEVYSHLDSIKDTADRMTSGNFMHNRAAIKFSANTIAKVLELMGLKAQKGEQYGM